METTNRVVLPVDSENKAVLFPRISVAAPHMRAFHLSWISFFACFISIFAAAPLMPIIRDDLNFTSHDIGYAGIASVTGAIISRIAMGTACDLFGPRLASTSVILITSPAVFLTASVNSPLTFLLARFFTGFSLSTFVSSQFWMSSMFSAPVVGLANGIAAGWGNFGGGITQLIMPLVYELVLKFRATSFTAWRIAFLIPALFQTFTAYAVFFLGQDLPEGNYHELQNSGERRKDKVSKVLYHAIRNYRGWILALAYGYSFGVELTLDNIVAEYFYDRFDMNLHTARISAASFGLSNIVSRPIGGLISDVMGRRFGMRGRLWSLFAVLITAGLLCILFGIVPSLQASISVMVVFSLFVQAACGLIFGIVPFISRRSLGVVSGITGAGGNLGAVVTTLIFFTGSRFSTETGITLMGIMMICFTFPLLLIYFPQWGGIVCGPSSDENATEEAYYLSEWSVEEQERGLHQASLRFAENSRGERGRRGRVILNIRRSRWKFMVTCSKILHKCFFNADKNYLDVDQRSVIYNVLTSLLHL